MTARTPDSRLPDWRPRLVAYLTTVAGKPFGYGTHDCALFAAGAVEAMTGNDWAADYRGRYSTLKEGLKLLDQGALRDHVALLDARLESIPPAFAAVGDIAVIGEDGTRALGIFEGESILVLRETGLGHVPRADAVAAYRVP